MGSVWDRSIDRVGLWFMSINVCMYASRGEYGVEWASMGRREPSRRRSTTDDGRRTTAGMVTTVNDGTTTTDAVVVPSATARAMEAVRAEVEKFRDDASATLRRSEERVAAAAAETRDVFARGEARERKLREEMACIRENVEAVMAKATELLSGRNDGGG